MRNTGVTNLPTSVFFVPEPATTLILFGLLAACRRRTVHRSASNLDKPMNASDCE